MGFEKHLGDEWLDLCFMDEGALTRTMQLPESANKSRLCLMQDLGHTYTKVPCHLSEIQVILGILYFIWKSFKQRS